MRTLRFPIIAGILSILLLAILAITLNPVRHTTGLLEVTFLNVGQGDATLIESPTGRQVLIDGGKGNAVLGPLNRAMGFFDRDIDMIIATHPDADHIGGLVAVLKRYRVHTIVMTENESDSPVFSVFKKAVYAEGARIIFARTGEVFDMGSGASGSTTLTILFPDHDPSGLESNVSSIVSRLTYGASEYLFTGDSPQAIEEYLVGVFGIQLQSDVLKVGHHGSRTSTAEAFLIAVEPAYGIISAGKDNTYGHPHSEVTDLLTAKGVIQKNTAEMGSILSFSNGQTVWFK
jgi:competence protein ComEC